MGIMRTLQIGDQPTQLALALADLGRIDKTIHVLNYIDDQNRRRATLQQLNRTESRHSLARDVFHGKRGELRQRDRDGQEDRLGALGLVVNTIVLWNTVYMDAALAEIRREETLPVLDEDVRRLSRFAHGHINLLGRYNFAVPEAVTRGELRPLRQAGRLRVFSVPLLPKPHLRRRAGRRGLRSFGGSQATPRRTQQSQADRDQRKQGAIGSDLRNAGGSGVKQGVKQDLVEVNSGTTVVARDQEAHMGGHHGGPGEGSIGRRGRGSAHGKDGGSAGDGIKQQAVGG